MTSHPIHTFEDLGEEKPIDEWDYDEVYEVIKERLMELHLLGIAHNDVRIANIHVSLSGKYLKLILGCQSVQVAKNLNKRISQH